MSLLVEAQMKDRVFELARKRQRPEVRAERSSLFNVARRRLVRTLDDERRGRIVAIDLDRQVRILDPLIFNLAREPTERYARAHPAIRSQRAANSSALSRRRLEQLRARNHLID